MRIRSIPKINISIPFVMLMAVLYVGDFRNVFFPTILAILLHELGHIAAIKLCGGTIESIDIKAFGARLIVPELKLMPYKAEIIIAAAGPAAGILAAAAAAAAAKILGTCALDYFIGISIVITAVNMIPVYPLDGGRIALGLCLLILPLRIAYTVCHILSILSVSALFSLCVVLSMYDALNPTIVIFSLYIAFCSIRSRPLI